MKMYIIHQQVICTSNFSSLGDDKVGVVQGFLSGGLCFYVRVCFTGGGGVGVGCSQLQHRQSRGSRVVAGRVSWWDDFELRVFCCQAQDYIQWHHTCRLHKQRALIGSF